MLEAMPERIDNGILTQLPGPVCHYISTSHDESTSEESVSTTSSASRKSFSIHKYLNLEDARGA
jgi:hypothetical protein